MFIDRFEIKFVCDLKIKNLKKIDQKFNRVKNYKNSSKFGEIDAVFICSNPISHFKIANYFLDNNVNVFVEKPICDNLKQFKYLKRKAKIKKLILFEDLIFLHDAKIKVIKTLVNQKNFGSPVVINSSRTNLGGFQFNTNVLDDLLSHDLSIIFYLFKNILIKSNCILYKTVKGLPHSIAHLTLLFSKKLLVNLTLSWHSPIKIRQIDIVGSNKMLTYDGLKEDESIKLLNKSFALNNNKEFDYRIGNIVSPNIKKSPETLISSILEFEKIVLKKNSNHKYLSISEKVLKAKEMIKKNVHFY